MAIEHPDGSTSEWEGRLGEQIRAIRLDRGHDQKTLAELADVGLTALKNLENGKGSSLKTFIRVIRALDEAPWLSTLAPEIEFSPIDVLRSMSATGRQRVYRPRAPR